MSIDTDTSVDLSLGCMMRLTTRESILDPYEDFTVYDSVRIT